MTLTGLGGVGKTRLARRAAAEAEPDFPDGVRMVELGELHDGSLLVDVVAAGLGLRDESARPLHDVLVDFLAPRRLLLVMDNCEQLIDDVARLTEELLQACPSLRVLATSRERLGVYGEAVQVVAPLAYPDSGATPALDLLGRFDAVALFRERAALRCRTSLSPKRTRRRSRASCPGSRDCHWRSSWQRRDFGSCPPNNCWTDSPTGTGC